MKKFQYFTIIATALLYGWMFLGISCNKCSKSNEETTVVTSDTDTIYGGKAQNATENYDAEYDNANSSASAGDNTSGTATTGSNKENIDAGSKKDTVKKVPSGGSTAKEARFSSSGSN